MSAILQEIITLLTSGITQMATGIGNGLVALTRAIFLNETSDGLNEFGGIVILFGGIALAIGLSRWVVNWLTSWGQ